MNLARGPLFESSAEEIRSTDDDYDRNSMRMLTRQRDRLRELQSRLEANGNPIPEGVTNASSSNLNSRYELLRDATNTMRSLQDGYDVLRRRGARPMVTVTGREIGVRTAGLAVSRDGSTVWAATEEGVFEIRVALKARMCWPAVQMR